MNSAPSRQGSVKYVPPKRWRRLGKSSFRNARSLSKRLNHLFCRRNSYSLLNRKPSRNSFELINICGEVSVAPLTALRPCLGQAQVWGVRNCFSKSTVEDLQFDLDLSPTSKNKESKEVTGEGEMQNAKFDDPGSVKDSGIATSGESEQEEKFALRHQNANAGDEKAQGTGQALPDSANTPPTTPPTGIVEPGSSLELGPRGRLQSFGSSACYTDSLSHSRGCSYSSSPREPSMSDDFPTSADSLDSLDASYWDLPFVDNYSDNQRFQYSIRNRRNSDSMVRDPRLADGSPRLRMGLANRRMSESWAIRMGNLYGSMDRVAERGDLKNLSVRSRRDKDVADSISESGSVTSAPVNDIKTTDENKAAANLPGSVKAENRAVSSIKKSSRTRTRSECCTTRESEKKRAGFQRSRSADFRKFQRSRKNLRQNSLILRRSAAFSDIESSDESSYLQPIASSDTDTPEMRGRSGKPNTLSTLKPSDGVKLRKNNHSSEASNPESQSMDSFAEESIDDKDDIDDVSGTAEESVEGMISETEGLNSSLEFLPVKDLMFCSGEHGTPGDSGADEMNKVIEAVQREADKSENDQKDMMVMFFVGGELKVLRRSALPSHGERSFQDLPSMTRKDPFSFHNGSSSHISNGSSHYASSYVTSPALHEANRGRPKSAIIITRSQSFAGMASQPSTPRRDGTGQGIVLGESFRHHRGATMPTHPKTSPGSRGASGFSFKKSPKVPKVPRPNRALLMFQSVKRGIREFIEATKDDIFQLQQRETDGTSTAQGRLHETDKQMKSAERYLKRLEFHLAKLDELHEYYLLQQQLREGVRTMHKAYVTSPGPKKAPLSNVKYGYKECTQTMCNIEAQLEAMMGTFNCKLKGIAGFARLCPGDVFEVTVRHGTQKWKTKGRIEKTGNQKWDIPDYNFKAVVGDVINIKGVEVRPFKSVLLGQKSCETKDLFSANPQLMTVSINVNGSLKLSIVIVWNPLEGVDESYSLVDTPFSRSQGTPRRTRPVSVLALNGQYTDLDPSQPDSRRHSQPVRVQQTKDDNFILRPNAPSPEVPRRDNVTSYHGLDSPHVVARNHEHLPAVYQTQTQTQTPHTTGPILSQTSGHAVASFHSNPVLSSSLSPGGDANFARQFTAPANQSSVHSSAVYPPSFSHLHFPGVSTMSSSSLHGHENGDGSEEGSVNIEDVLHNLSSVLEDYHGQYVELQKLEELVKYAQKLMRKQFRNSSRSSSISVSIEDALEAFDFLDTEDALEDPQSPTDHTTKTTFDDLLCSPESTAKTADSGIESLAQRLSEDHAQLGSSLDSSPTPPSTGNEEVDQCLIYHLTYCERLLENLGQFGPLKCHEIYALDKIQKQTTIVDNLLKLAKTGSQADLHNVMSSLCDDKSLREFWVKCTDQNSLYVPPERLVTGLEQKFATVIQETYTLDPTKVCEHVVTRILDIPDYEQEKGRSTFVMTLHQFMAYFKEEGGLKHVQDVASEMKLVEHLTSGNPDAVIKAILSLRDTLPSAPCLKVIGMLIVTMDTEVEQCIISYLSVAQRREGSRERALVVFVEGLEDQSPEIRAGACAALGILEASESTDQLVYLWQSDASPLVQQRAKSTLLSLGEEGKKAFEEAQLSKHGFQGIQVHK